MYVGTQVVFAFVVIENYVQEIYSVNPYLNLSRTHINLVRTTLLLTYTTFLAVGPFTKPTKTIPKLPNLYKICIMCIWVWYLVIGLVKEHPFTKPYTKQKGPFTKPNLKFTLGIPIDQTNQFIIVC